MNSAALNFPSPFLSSSFSRAGNSAPFAATAASPKSTANRWAWRGRFMSGFEATMADDVGERRPLRGGTSDRERNVLRFHKRLEPLRAQLATPPALLESAERTLA